MFCLPSHPSQTRTAEFGQEGGRPRALTLLRLLKLRRRSILLAAEIQPELRLLARSLYANRNLRPRSVFLEEAVGRLEQRS